MRYWAVALLALAAFVLQTTVAVHLAVGGVSPDLFLGLTLVLGLLFGWPVGAAVGLAGGLLFDLTLGRYVGLHALSLGITGLVAGLMEPRIVKENPFLPMVSGALGSLVEHTVTLVVLFLLQKSIFGAYRSTLAIGTVYDALVCALIYPLVFRYQHYLHPTLLNVVTGRRP